MPEIISRAAWGARYPAGFGVAPLPAQTVWLHHSVTIAPDLVQPFDDDYAAVRQLEQIGHSRFGGGISYTFCVTPAGLVFEGHGVGRLGAHTYGHNLTGRGIVLVGDYTSREPTSAQLDAVGWLLHTGHAAGWWLAPRLTGGHRDVKATGCPGDAAYALIPEMNRRAAALAGQETDMATAQELIAALQNLYDDRSGGRRNIFDSLVQILNNQWLIIDLLRALQAGDVDEAALAKAVADNLASRLKD